MKFDPAHFWRRWSLLEAFVPESHESSAEEVVVLKDPALAAFLGWLIPGLGHWYQGRRAKAVLYFVCIMGTFALGVYLGGNREVGWGRTVYFSWRGDNDDRLAFICQIGIGIPAWPALLQANRMANHEKVLWHGFMAPPRSTSSSATDMRDDPNSDQPTLSKLHLDLHRFFELGTAFTMIGGLLNVLAIYDAWGGPVTFRPKKEEETPSGKPEKASTES
jgi:hypothetical protein